MKTVNITNEQHKQLRIAAAKSEKEIKEIVADALKEYLTQHKFKV